MLLINFNYFLSAHSFHLLSFEYFFNGNSHPLRISSLFTFSCNKKIYASCILHGKIWNVYRIFSSESFSADAGKFSLNSLSHLTLDKREEKKIISHPDSTVCFENFLRWDGKMLLLILEFEFIFHQMRIDLRSRSGINGKKLSEYKWMKEICFVHKSQKKYIIKKNSKTFLKSCNN